MENTNLPHTGVECHNFQELLSSISQNPTCPKSILLVCILLTGLQRNVVQILLEVPLLCSTKCSFLCIMHMHNVPPHIPIHTHIIHKIVTLWDPLKAKVKTLRTLPLRLLSKFSKFRACSWCQCSSPVLF